MAKRLGAAEIDMLNGPLLGKIIRFIIPLILTRLLQLCFNAADTAVIGRCVGDSALAAVGGTTVLIALLMWIYNGLGSGVAIVVSNDIGSGSDDEISRSIHTAMTSSVMIGLILMILAYILAKPALRLLGTPSDIFDGSVLYLSVYLVGLPAILVYQFGAAVMRAVGDTQKPVFFLAISGALNLVMNLIFVLVFHLNIFGVALATVLSQYLSAFLIVRYMHNLDDRYKLDFKKLGIDKEKFVKMIKLSVPAAVQGMMFAVSDMGIQTAVNSIGSLAVSGNAAALSIDGFVFIPMDALTQACMVFSGQNVGAKKYDRSVKAIRLSAVIAAVLGLAVGIIIFVLKTPLVKIYLPDSPEAVSYGVGRLSIVSTTCFIYGILDCISAGLRSYGSSSIPAIISIVGISAFRLLWVFLYFPHHMTMFHLYLCYPLAWIICIILEVPALIHVIKKRKAQDAI